MGRGQIAPDKTSIKQKGDSLKAREELIFAMNRSALLDSNGKRDLQLDKEMELAIELVSQYMNREPKFEIKEGFRFNKGLWICGNFGSGKTLLLKSYKEAVKNLYGLEVGFQSCSDMNSRYLKRNEMTRQLDLFDGIKMFCNKFESKERIFDDLGEEETYVMDYGNKVCLMAHILSERYKGLRNGSVTHITTNLTMDQVSNIYGGRIESRISEMFNVIKLGSKSDSKDYRK